MFFPMTHNPSEHGQAESPQKPFTIFIEHLDKTRDGHWRPAAHLRLSRAIRTSGFLNAVPAEELKHLLFLLSFLTANGDCLATVPQLAAAMKLSTIKAKARMQRLAEWQWQGQPVVCSTVLGNGLEAYALAPGAIPIEEEPMTPFPSDSRPPLPTAPREAIIAQSRERYGRPRAEVEHQIAEQMNWKNPPQAQQSSAANPVASNNAPSNTADAAPVDPNIELRQELVQVGILPEQADELIARFDPVRIRRQLMWLPYRIPRNRAGFLVAAIKDDYEAPPNLRRREVTQEEAASTTTPTNLPTDEC
jgi:hypothetical protein